MILLLSEYLPPTEGEPEMRHIVSVFKLVQELLAPSRVKGRISSSSCWKSSRLIHKARWFACSALNTAEQAIAP